MKDAQIYANQWEVSAKYFYDNGYYLQMAQAINEFHTVVEIGCDTGYSTLELAKLGHKVIAIDKNAVCIEKAKNLLYNNGISEDNVIFVEGDIADSSFRDSIVSNFSFDIVICWNIGSYWNKEMLQYYTPHMLEYGLDILQIRESSESSYAELIIWDACILAKSKQVAIHIIDRTEKQVNECNDIYYRLLKDEIGYDKISYNNINAKSISKGGRPLVTNGVVNTDNVVNIVFVSMLMK